jgi:hypothetical protein
MAKAEQTVVALATGYFGVDGESIAVIEGETFRSDDPVVKKYPAFFTRTDNATVIEHATAAPGEKRG